MAKDRRNPQIACIRCHRISPIMWPDELSDEIRSQDEYIQHNLSSCSNKKCPNLGHNIQLYPEQYYAFGFSGDKRRYRCKACQKTLVDRFSVTNPHLKVHVTILALILTGFSLKEVADKLTIQAKTLNDHLKSMANMCRQKSTVFDHHWHNSAKRLLLGTDYCHLQPESDNGVLWICSADLDSHYVPQQTFNLSHKNRANSRRLIAKDTVTSINTAPSHPASHALIDVLQAWRVNHHNRSHRSNPLHNKTQLNYPVTSLLVTPLYSATAHFMQLDQWMDDKEHVVFSMPFEPMLANGALYGSPRLRHNNALDLIYQMDDAQWSEHKAGSKPQVLSINKYDKPWSLSEQWRLRGKAEQRAICQVVEQHLSLKQAHQLPKLSPISQYMDRFHAMFKSCVNEPRRKRRPEGLLPLLDIYRAWHNLCHQNKPGETPAVKAGISEKPLSLEQLLQ